MPRFILFTLICATTINFATAQQNIRDKFLVEKVFVPEYPEGYPSYEFVYDTDNRLIKIIQGKEKSVSIFEYENNRVTKIHYKDLVYFIEYYTLYYYNSQNQLIREEGRYHDGKLGTWSEFYYKNGIVDSIYCFDGKYSSDQPNLIFWHSMKLVYNEAKNVVKVIGTGPTISMNGVPHPYETEVWEIFYEYDDKPKPNFGIDHLFAYSALKGPVDLLTYERLLSVNNMTKTTYGSGTTYNYTYNEHGLPVTYQEIRGNGQPYSTFTITYKEIELGVASATHSEEVLVYPNPTTGELRIENGELRIMDIEVFDIYGRNCHVSRVAGHENNINISHLSAGIYFVKITTETVQVVKKVVKE